MFYVDKREVLKKSTIDKNFITIADFSIKNYRDYNYSCIYRLLDNKNSSQTT